MCVDFLKTFREFGTQTTCDTLNPYTDLEPNRMFMEFRSNRRSVYITVQQHYKVSLKECNVLYALTHITKENCTPAALCSIDMGSNAEAIDMLNVCCVLNGHSNFSFHSHLIQPQNSLSWIQYPHSVF